MSRSISTPFDRLASVVRNPHFANPVYPADNYRLPFEWLGVWFVPFDSNEAGRYQQGPRIQPPAIPATFKTLTYNPATDF